MWLVLTVTCLLPSFAVYVGQMTAAGPRSRTSITAQRRRRKTRMR